MIRYFLSSLVVLFSVYESDNNFEYGKDELTARRTSQVIYGGMTLECSYGCGDPLYNSGFGEISYILNYTIPRVFSVCHPIYADPLTVSKDYEFAPWESVWYYKYQVYDWELTKGFYLSKKPRKEYSFHSYPQFLELASALRRDIWMIEIAEKYQNRAELLAKLYLLEGQVQSEYGLYAEAVIGLTKAIQKNPVTTSKEFIAAAIQCIEYIQSHSTAEIIQSMVKASI